MPDVKEFKSQPWILFDNVISKSYLLGDDREGNRAVGSSGPAINKSGEIVFFTERKKANHPWYTNLDTPGQLSYGMEIWQMYLLFKFPSMIDAQTTREDESETFVFGSPPKRLAECILYHGVLSMDLGQENQVEFPLTRFGAGGGLVATGSGIVGGMILQNSQAQAANVLKLPEPIQCPRTQNFFAKIRLAPEIHGIIGSVAAPGVGSPLGPYTFYDGMTGDDPPVPIIRTVENPPFGIEFGLVGRRVKKSQYGQVPAD